MNRQVKHLKLFFLIILFSATGTGTGHSVELSQLPLFVTSSVEPNLMFIIDDSGSMMWETLDDDVTDYFVTGIYADWWNRMVAYVYPQHSLVPSFGVDYQDCIYHQSVTVNCDYWRDATNRGVRQHIVPGFDANDPWAAFFRSAHNNMAYYNPEIRYAPWVDHQDREFPQANILSAFHNPALQNKGWRDLTVTNHQRACWLNRNATSAQATTALCTLETRSFWPATYFTYTGSDIHKVSSYKRIEIRNNGITYKGGPDRTDCVDPEACTYDEEIQNFANWYSYHRSRVLASLAGIGRAFAQQADNIRVGLGSINAPPTVVDGVTTSNIINGVRGFSGKARKIFFERLYSHNWPMSGTPLRQALKVTGEYFRRQDSKGPWGANPGYGVEAVNSHAQCRQSYTVLMSDGYWNGPSPGLGNVDNIAGPIIKNDEKLRYQYLPRVPFHDSFSNTLADTALYYWNRDLRPDLPNRVRRREGNEAFWQNMVTYTVGMGVIGDIESDMAYESVRTREAIYWPDPAASNAGKADDMLHAAVNARGGHFSAADTDSFSRELSRLLQALVASATASSTSVATNSTRVDSESLIYQARFNSGDWSGDLLAFELEPDGKPGDIRWRAAETLVDVPSDERIVFTYNSNQGRGVLFEWSEISAQHQEILNEDGFGSERIAYLRGNRELERSQGGHFRDRASVLGDIVNSNPAYAADQSFGYRLLPGVEGSSYEDFVSNKKSRTPVVYVGANDGMLHAFNADSGEPLFSYVPGSVIDDLAVFTDRDYEHRYFVDGSPAVADVYINNRWKTLLLGTLGAGGRTIFALDVTDPDNFSEQDVLWEFSHPELGEGVTEVSIVRMPSGRSQKNGDWVAIFGNGYNSASASSQLFIVDLKSGQLLQRLDTGVTGNNGKSNGMAPPLVIDVIGDRNADLIYSGDLEGYLWKFERNNQGKWVFADLDDNVISLPGEQPSSLPENRALFRALRDDVAQPITSKPDVARFGADLMIYLGTGKFIEQQDLLDTVTIQSLYGVIDRGHVVRRHQLLQQDILSEKEVSGRKVRITSDHRMENHPGWRLDLVDSYGSQGERVISRPLVRGNRVTYSTLIPSQNPCDLGGSSWLITLDSRDGARSNANRYDLDDDGYVDKNDSIRISLDGTMVDVVASGMKSMVGIVSRPVYLSAGHIDHVYLSGSSGEIEQLLQQGDDTRGRRSWRQIR